MVPININIGTATRIKFSQIPPHILLIILKNSIKLNTSKAIPKKPYPKPTPPKTKATGKPLNNNIAKVKNMKIGNNVTKSMVIIYSPQLVHL